jgi:hypothetical protein
LVEKGRFRAKIERSLERLTNPAGRRGQSPPDLLAIFRNSVGFQLDLVISYLSGRAFRKPQTKPYLKEHIMQRLLNNLLAAAVVGLVSSSASLVMAHGGGHGGGGHHSGRSAGHTHSGHHASHKGGNHRGAHHTSVSHRSHSHLVSHDRTHNRTNIRSVVGIGGFRGYHPRWYGYNRYPVGFWLGGNYGVVGANVVGTSVAPGGIDVEFSKIAQIDAGDPTKNLAPAYRVWFHNNSTVDIDQPFDVALLASSDKALSAGLPYASVRVDSLAADETMSVDIRLPMAAMTMGSSDGQAAPFAYVHTIIDSQKELVETNKANNVSIDSRDDIPAVAE